MRAFLRSVICGLNVQYWKQYERVLGAVLVGTSIGMAWEVCAANCGAHHQIGSRNTPSPEALAKPAIATIRAQNSEGVVFVDWPVSRADPPTGFQAAECWLPRRPWANPEAGGKSVVPALSVEM